MWTCSEVRNSLHILKDNLFARYGNAIFRKVIGIPVGTNCAPLVAELLLYCYERDFMLSLKPDSQADVINASNNTFRYWDDIFVFSLSIFDSMVSSIYPKELTFKKANSSDSSAAFLDLDLSK